MTHKCVPQLCNLNVKGPRSTIPNLQVQPSEVVAGPVVWSSSCSAERYFSIKFNEALYTDLLSCFSSASVLSKPPHSLVIMLSFWALPSLPAAWKTFEMAPGMVLVSFAVKGFRNSCYATVNEVRCTVGSLFHTCRVGHSPHSPFLLS